MPKGGTQTPEARARISAGLKGKRLSEETKAKIRASLLGRQCRWSASTPPPLPPVNAEAIQQQRRDRERRVRDIYHESGVRCCTLAEWVEWGCGQHLYADRDMGVGLKWFCGEALPGWCEGHRQEGRCVKSDARREDGT